VLRFECDGFHLPIPLCTLGVVRDFPDFGTEPAVFGADDDFERAPPTCPRAAMKLWLHMSALCQEQTLGRPLAMIVFGTVLKSAEHHHGTSRRRFLHVTASTAGLSFIPRLTWAQSYPARPVRL